MPGIHGIQERSIMADMYERVKHIVVEHLGVEENQVTPNASFTDDLNADSLDLVEMVMAIEEEFAGTHGKMDITDDDAARLKTVQDVMDYLKDRGVEDTPAKA